MSLFRQCFTTDTVDTTHEKRWYKQPKQKIALQGSLYSNKNDLSKTNNLNSIQSPDNNKLSHFYNDRYPDKYLPGQYRSIETELEKLKQQNIGLRRVLRHEVEPLRLRYTQLIQEGQTKNNIISGLQSRLGFGRIDQPIEGISHRIARGLIHRQ